MSGTSLDGPDLALCFFPEDNPASFQIVRALTVDYSEEMRARLRTAHLYSALDLKLLENTLTAFWAKKITAFLRSDRPQFISCSGHTVFHQPHLGLTHQIGNGAMLSALTALPVVTDFRSADVALGGQGAPLVPFADPLLFPQYNAWLNIGGIANVTLRNAQGGITAFDICPANMLLNDLAERSGKPYDAGGEMAKSGHVDENLLEKMNSLKRFAENDRSSLGREWYENEMRPLLEGPTEDLLATSTVFVARMIARAIGNSGPVLITGGGAHNTHLFQLLAEALKTPLAKAEPDIINFKEALIFAFLGLKRWRGEINTLPAVTGARAAVSAGAIYRPFG